MTYSEKLQRRITATGSCLCVGLDPRPEFISGSVRDFLQRVVEETAPFAAAFKPNSAYFEASGWEGVRLLEEIRALIPAEIPVVLDAKRSDIGETQRYYAKAAFEVLAADAVTLNPYLGFDTIEPFLGYAGRALYLLAVTSNAGAADIELGILAEGCCVFERVLKMAVRAAGAATEVGFVIGLTNAAGPVLEKVPDVPLLIPGFGAQGGDPGALSAQNRSAPLLINASRSILYARPEQSLAEKARQAAEEIAAALALR